jgi:hypothetical protein
MINGRGAVSRMKIGFRKQQYLEKTRPSANFSAINFTLLDLRSNPGSGRNPTNNRLRHGPRNYERKSSKVNFKGLSSVICALEVFAT